jgi:hypothetical protein
MDGRGAEDETAVTIHIAKLGRSGPYQTALGPHRETSCAAGLMSWLTSVLADGMLRPAMAPRRVSSVWIRGTKLSPPALGQRPDSRMWKSPATLRCRRPPLRLSLIPLISPSIESKLCASYVIWGLHHYTRNWNFLLHQCYHYWPSPRLGLVRAAGCCHCGWRSALNCRAGLR